LRMVEIAMKYEGGLRCTANHGPSGAELSTDAPRDNMGKGEAFSPTDLTCTSLGSCMLTTMDIAVKKKELSADITGATALVRKYMTDAPPRRIAKIEVEITLPLPAEHPDRETLEWVALNCPVALSLHPDVEKAVTFLYNS